MEILYAEGFEHFSTLSDVQSVYPGFSSCTISSVDAPNPGHKYLTGVGPVQTSNALANMVSAPSRPNSVHHLFCRVKWPRPPSEPTLPPVSFAALYYENAINAYGIRLYISGELVGVATSSHGLGLVTSAIQRNVWNDFELVMVSDSSSVITSLELFVNGESRGTYNGAVSSWVGITPIVHQLAPEAIGFCIEDLVLCVDPSLEPIGPLSISPLVVSSDISNVGFVDQDGATTNIYQSLTLQDQSQRDFFVEASGGVSSLVMGTSNIMPEEGVTPIAVTVRSVGGAGTDPGSEAKLMLNGSPIGQFANTVGTLDVVAPRELWSTVDSITLGISAIYVPPPVGIGIPGEIGFGVGICPEESWLTELNLIPMPGYDNPTNPNYGNYIHSNGSICVFIPKFYYRIGSTESPRYAEYGLNCIDIVDSSEFESTAEANAAGYALHRAFIDGGVEKPGFFYDKYVLSRDGDIGVSVKNGQPISLASTAGYVVSSDMPGCTGILADAVILGRARGTGWSCISLFTSDALAKISMAHGQAATSIEACAWYDPAGVTNFPKGCNNDALGDQNDPSIVYVSSGEADANKPLTGSANHFAKTTHNGQECGVCDVNGVIVQVALGVTNFGTSATATSTISSGNALILKESVRLSDLTGGWNGATDAWATEANMASKYDPIVLPWGNSISLTHFGNGTNQVFSGATSGSEWLKSCSGIQASTAGTSTAGTNLFGNDGCNQYNRQNMLPSTSGTWSSAQSGVWYRFWRSHRTTWAVSMGVRVCAYGS